MALAALGTVLVAVGLVGPGYFADAMGHRPGDPEGQAMDAATLAAFQEAIRTALAAALVIALIAAAIVAAALAGRIATPVTRLVGAARRIADGHYAERVATSGEDEIAELGETFNAMAGSLEGTERRRLELVGDVAHELRTPLATLDGYLEGLQDGVVEPGPETWTLLRRETGRLTRLVDDLSELWRAEARQLPLTIQRVATQEIVRDVVEQFRTTAAARSISITMLVPDVSFVNADRDRLAQIVGNYLSNAIRYGPEGSAVMVEAATNAAEVVISVRDAGPGLTAQQRAHVFDRFYRVDPSRSRAVGGAGIGLAIARALASAMNGRVWAESEGSGKGATFVVAVPSA